MESPFYGRFTTKWTWVSDRRFSGRWRSRLSRRSRLSLNRTVKAHQAMLGGFIGLLVQWFQWSMMDHDGPWLFHDYSIWFVCGMTPLTMWNTVKHCETNFCFFFIGVISDLQCCMPAPVPNELILFCFWYPLIGWHRTRVVQVPPFWSVNKCVFCFLCFLWGLFIIVLTPQMCWCQIMSNPHFDWLNYPLLLV